MKKKLIRFMAGSLVIAAAINPVKAKDDVRLLRYPDINKNQTVFVYAGDIWSVNSNGGDAVRLTSHKGMELFPKISPDGKWIAFSGEYSGSRQVYVMPAKGGTPKQLTWYNDVGAMPPRGGFDNVVLDWTSDSHKIMVRSNRTSHGERNGRYYLVDINGGMEEEMIIPEGGFGVLSPDDKKVCFAAISREFRTWKRYKGGRAGDLWIYDLEKNSSKKITQFKGTDQIPTWYGQNIFFASDRSLTLNIHKYNTETAKVEQVTNFKKFDVMWPSGNGNMMVFENGGYIYKLNLDNGQSERLKVNISFDNPNTLAYYKNVKGDVHSWSVSPSGKRALFDARGDIFSVPAKNGITENLTNTQGVREIFAAWSPNGKYISYVSDKTGEYEIYLLENKKGAEAKQLTKNSTAWKYMPAWSPDSKWLLYYDRTMQLKLLNVETAKEVVVDKSNAEELRDFAFSADSQWITYAKDGDNGQNAIWVYDIDNATKHEIVDSEFNNSDPVFSQDGKYLFFTSNRDFNLEFSSFEFTYLYNDATRIYAVALTKDAPSLFKIKNDEVEVKEEKKAEDKPKKDKKKSTKKEAPKKDKLTIDFDGIQKRIAALPMKSGRYWSLKPVKGGLLYGSNDGIKRYDIDSEESKTVIGGVYSADLTADGKKLMYSSRGSYGIVSASGKSKSGDGKIKLDDLEMKIDPRQEWNQIYTDGWRIFRDYFYVRNIHNVDWEGLKAKYAELVPHVSHRADLDYILGEIIAESNAGHAYVNYGDFEKVKRIDTGLLGAKLVADKKAGRYQIVKIYTGENWTPSRRSPLTEQGVDVKEGDYLISINGHDVTLADNPYQFLENTIGKIVTLQVNDKASTDGVRTCQVKPIKSELELMYLDWVRSRRAMVDKLSGGRIGYIHAPNTAVEGNRELFRGMYSFHNKEALIIDDRYNGGGFIPASMVELLNRETLSWWHRRGLKSMKTPGVAHDGPKAMLINGYSSSGGDAFPYYFRKKKLGKLIGTRTWGGLVGISGNARLVDGGYIAVPRFGVYDENSKWIIEGIGVYPDIEVVDAPHLISKGIDPCIERAVKELLQELNAKPVKEPAVPADPDRKEWIEQEIK
ncbi:acetyl-CoA synthetase [Prolixibacteraceae bacterium JC049]|nr:acetyl-CoA synthetase [Prolixibacteraceae bacterium JC049]